MDLKHPSLPRWIASLHALVGASWIVLSDTLVTQWHGRTFEDWLVNSGKGLAFVAVTSGALYLLLRRWSLRLQKAWNELEAGEQRWEYALHSAGDGLWDWNIVTGDVFFSRQWKAMLGHDDHELQNRLEEWESRLHPDDRDAAIAAVERYLGGHASVYESVYRLRCKDGSYRWILDRGKIIARTPDRRPLRMIGTHADITEAKLAEQRMADELAFNAALFNSSPIGMITYGADGAAVSANAAATQMLDTTADQLCRQNLRQTGFWRTTGLIDAAEMALRTGTKFRQEVELITASGRRSWIAAQFVPFRYREEARLLLLMSDVTGRKEAEHQLKAAGEFTRAILDSLTISIAILDRSGRILSVNRAWRTFAQENGVRLEEVCEGANYFAVARSATGADDQQTAELLEGIRAVATGEREEFSHEYPCHLPTRKRWFQGRVSPFAGGGPGCVVVTHEDITARREALAQLHLMHAALEAAPNGCVITGVDGRIQWANKGFTDLTGYTLAEARGTTPRLVKSDRHPPEFYAELWRTIKSGHIWSGEILNRRKDGVIYPEQMTIAPLRDAHGEITHFVAIKQDISERKKLEQQFARTQRLESVGLLASGIAHDLNNIFSPILLSIDLLNEKYPTADARKTLEMIACAGRRGAAIVRQVLTFARGIGGERVPVQPKYVIRELEHILRETLPREIEIRLNLAAELSPVIGDATQLHQVLLNLAINARDAMPGGGQLTLAARQVQLDEIRLLHDMSHLKAGRYVALIVADTGTGIPPEVMEHMFEPFFTTKPRGKGTGLGLSTVYGIVRSHGGTVEVNSQLGRGSEFVVLLPAAPKDASVADAAPPTSSPFDGDSRRVLVVDDEESIRLITLHVLQRHGFVVEVAADGVEASERFHANPTRYDAVITDLMMPRRGGRDLIREIRRFTPTLPIIATSGLSDDNAQQADDEALIALGVTTLLRKPYTEAELIAALRNELAPDSPTRAHRTTARSGRAGA
ncbi:MAG TPA: PAS domain S-box protein [Opitutaceae bacterium]